MRLIRLHLTDFAGIHDREVTFAESGVTVVEGPNESGKTTLLRAFDFLLTYLDSSKDKRIEAVRPAGTGLGPTVEAEFVTGGQRVRYAKRWLSQQHTEAEILDRGDRLRRLTGREAHEAVRSLLDASLDWNLWSALQVQQGTSLELPAFGTSASLKEALNRAASGKLGGESEDVLYQRVHQERERYLSPTGGVGSKGERGPLQAARESERRARQHLDDAQLAFAKAEEAAEELAAGRWRLAEKRSELDRAASDLVVAKTEHEALVAAQLRVERLKEAQQQAGLRLTNAKLLLAGRRSLLQQAAEAAKHVRGLSEEIEKTQGASQAAAEKLNEAEGVFGTAQVALQEAQARFDRTDADREQLQRMGDIAPLKKRLLHVRDSEQKIGNIEGKLGELLVTDEALQGIEELHMASVQAATKLENSAASLQVAADQDLDILVDGNKLCLAGGASIERLVPDRMRIEIPGLVGIEVRGGGTAANLGRRAEASRRSLRDALAVLRVESVDMARTVNRQRVQLLAQLDALRQSLSEALAGDTPELISLRIRKMQEAIDGYWTLRPNDPAPPSDLTEAQEELAAARAALAERRLDRDGAAETLTRRTSAKATADEKATLYAKQLEDAQGDATQAEAALDQARGDIEDVALNDGVASTAQDLQSVSDDLAAEERALAARNPDRVEAAFTNAQQRHIRLSEDILQLQRDIAHGEGYLEQLALEGAGLSERLEVVREEQRRAAGILAAEVSRAKAADLLFHTLDKHLQVALRAYREPYREEVERLGRLVFGPDFAVDLDDDLSIAARSLNGKTLPAAQLSSGAKEQLGVIGRLACARLVSGEGVPVVLDDAFSYSDPERLRGLCLALDRAGGKGQVLLLTCDPERYRDLGEAKVLRLQRGQAVLVADSPARSVEVPPVAGTPEVPVADTAQRVLLVLRQSATALGKQEILASTEVAEAEWGRTIRALLDSGQVEQIGVRRGAVYRVHR